MATWYTHYRIANMLSDRNLELDRTAFIFGNLAPDSGLLISKLNYQPNSNVSHFTKESNKAYIKPLRLLDEYLPKVKNNAEFSFIMGYFIHLLTDKLYSNDVFKTLIIDNHIEDLKGKELAIIRNEWHHADALIYQDHKEEILRELAKINLRVSILDFYQDMHYLDMLNRITAEMNNVPEVDFVYTNKDDNTNFINNFIDILDHHLNFWLKPNKQYKYLFIDLDNTIYDFKVAENRALENTYLKYAIPFNPETYQIYDDINHELWHRLEDNLIEINELFWRRFELTLIELKKDHAIAKEMAEEFSHQLSLCMDYYEGVEETLKFLAKDYQIDIITNGIKAIQTPRINNSALKDIISHLFISEDIGYSKPNIEYFKTAINLAEVKDKSQVLVVGDGLSADIKGANNAHLDCVWITSLLNTTELKHELIIDNLSSLKTWLNRPHFNK